MSKTDLGLPSISFMIEMAFQNQWGEDELNRVRTTGYYYGVSNGGSLEHAVRTACCKLNSR